MAYTLVPLAICGLVALAWFYAHKRASTDAQRISAKTNYMTVLLVFTFTIFVSVSNTVFSYFGQHVLDDGSCFLYADVRGYFYSMPPPCSSHERCCYF